MSTIASCDQCKPIRMRETVLVNCKSQYLREFLCFCQAVNTDDCMTLSKHFEFLKQIYCNVP